MLIFTDIDDTLMKTKRKIKNIELCSVGSYSESGEVLSYIEPFHSTLINDFLKQHYFIPVTARSFSALKRVQIDFPNEKIINFGAHILDKNDKLNEDWSNVILKNQITNNIFEKIDYIKNNFSIPSGIKLIERIENNNFIFLNFRNSTLKLEDNILFSELFTNFLNQNNLNDFYLYVTDRDVTLIPNYIKKELAVDFLIKQYPNMASIGIGDHKNDFSFMHMCNFSLFPNDSSISKILKEFK